MDREIDKLLIELRPRIQAANFFILFRQSFAQFESTKIDLEANKIKIRINEEFYEINLSDHFNILTKTLSTLLIKNNYISFRINTNTSAFASEVLEVKHRDIEKFKLKIDLEPNVSYKISCANCECRLTQNATTFKRILELPSESMDMSDWFCHRHDGHSHSENNNTSFTPKSEEDLLYGSFYGLLSEKLFENVRSKNRKFIYCRRCLLYFGEIVNTSYKFWYETIHFKPDDDQSEKKDDDKDDDDANEDENLEYLMFKQGTILENFKFLIRKSISDHTINTFMELPPMFKLLFRTNKVNGDAHYLQLQIMDHNLNIFRMKDELDENNVISLSPFKTMKVLYKYEKFDNQPLIEHWLHDMNVVTLQISEKMMSAAIHQLDKGSQYVPECYRVNMGFCLSYLDT